MVNARGRPVEQFGQQGSIRTTVHQKDVCGAESAKILPQEVLIQDSAPVHRKQAGEVTVDTIQPGAVARKIHRGIEIFDEPEPVVELTLDSLALDR